MKRIAFVITMVALCHFSGVNAQNSEGKADDEARISITPQVNDQEIPEGAKNMLISKMQQICTKNGMAGDGSNPFFIMDATVDVLSKELTPTAPPMHALNLQVNFFIKDAINGNVYSQAGIEVKGVGKNETKAYIQALKSIEATQGIFKSMVDQGKAKIMTFYNSECDFVISKATALQKQGNNAEAIKVLKSVPVISKECYVKCMALLAEIEPVVETPSETSVAQDSDPIQASKGEMEIDENIFMVYTGNKILGNKLLLYFQFENRGVKDYEFNDYVYDTRIVDGDGAAHQTNAMVVGKAVGSKAVFTIINGVPVKTTYEFDLVEKVAMFEFKYNSNYQERVFRMKDIYIND